MRDLAQHITDLVENATRAGANVVSVEVEQRTSSDRLLLRVMDNGSGMDPDTAARAVDPFFTSRTCRRVGLGLPLLSASAERCEGRLDVRSRQGQGTTVEATFRLSHIDTPPLGDLGATLMCAVLGHPEANIHYRHSSDDGVFELDTATIRAELGDVPLSHPSVLRWLETYVTEGLATIGAAIAQEEQTHA